MTQNLKTIDAPLSWGLEDDTGVLENFAERDKPRQLKKNTYNSALVALGWKAVRVRIIRETDYKQLIRAARGKS